MVLIIGKLIINDLNSSEYQKFVELSLLRLAQILSNLKIININKIIYTSSASVYSLDNDLKNSIQIYNGEKISGVTLHKIDHGIDTGSIIDNIKFKLKINTNAYENYLNLMKYSLKLLIKNFKIILKKTYTEKKQNHSRGSYYSRNSVEL